MDGYYSQPILHPLGDSRPSLANHSSTLGGHMIELTGSSKASMPSLTAPSASNPVTDETPKALEFHQNLQSERQPRPTLIASLPSPPRQDVTLLTHEHSSTKRNPTNRHEVVCLPSTAYSVVHRRRHSLTIPLVHNGNPPPLNCKNYSLHPHFRVEVCYQKVCHPTILTDSMLNIYV